MTPFSKSTVQGINFASRQKRTIKRPGHNSVADGWAGASNPVPHLNHTPNPSSTHTHNTSCSIINTRFSRFQLERDNLSVMDQRTDRPMEGQSLLQSCVSATKKSESVKIKEERFGMESKRLGFGFCRWNLVKPTNRPIDRPTNNRPTD